MGERRREETNCIRMGRVDYCIINVEVHLKQFSFDTHSTQRVSALAGMYRTTTDMNCVDIRSSGT